MATGQLSPAPWLQFYVDGEPANGYLLFTYEAGTTTKLATYTNDTLTVANTNPIVLDSEGRCTVFLADDDYKMVLAEPTDSDPPSSPIKTTDGIRATPAASANIDIAGTAGEAITQYDVVYLSDGEGSLTAGRWYKTSSDHSYASVDAPSVGLAQTAAAGAGSAFSVRVSGKSTVAGTLSSGTTYYIGSTAGSLSSSSTQQNRAPFGQSDSTTTIIFPIQGTISISIKHALATFAYSGSGAAVAGSGNAAGGGDTEITAYEVSIPDNYMITPGSCLILEGLLVLAANTNSKSMKISIGASGVVTLFTNADNVANHRVPFRVTITRRTDILAGVMGLFYYGAAAGGTPSVYLGNAALSGSAVDWTAQQDLKIFLVGTADNDIWLTDYRVSQERSPYGTLV